jgi:hypothetical protein
MRHLQIHKEYQMITTVTRRLLSEDELLAKMAALAARNNVPRNCYDESAADQMSDFDAQKWLSLCDLLRSVRRPPHRASVSSGIPSSLRSIYGTWGVEEQVELENSPDERLALAA